MIVLPKYREIWAEPKLPAVRVRGRFKLEIVKADGRVRQVLEFPNLITNNGLDILSGTVGSGLWSVVCCVGTGTTAPANTDTALTAILASTSTIFSHSNSNGSTSPYAASAITTWQFAQGAAAGNISEVGCGPTTTSLFSHALILDSGGSPTTITVLSNEFLNVTYTLEMLPPLSDVTGTITLATLNYGYTIRAANVTNSGDDPGWNLDQYSPGNIVAFDSYIGDAWSFQASSTIGLITGQPSGTANHSPGPLAGSSYTVGSYNLTSTWTWGINDGNLTGGIGAILLQAGRRSVVGVGTEPGCRGCYQIAFGTPIPKDNTKQLTLNFNIAWARM